MRLLLLLSLATAASRFGRNPRALLLCQPSVYLLVCCTLTPATRSLSTTRPPRTPRRSAGFKEVVRQEWTRWRTQAPEPVLGLAKAGRSGSTMCCVALSEGVDMAAYRWHNSWHNSCLLLCVSLHLRLPLPSASPDACPCPPGPGPGPGPGSWVLVLSRSWSCPGPVSGPGHSQSILVRRSSHLEVSIMIPAAL
jgi:hypothetical protein